MCCICFLFPEWTGCSPKKLADIQLSLPSLLCTFLPCNYLRSCCCWATFSTAAFALQSSSCGCLLFLGWTGSSFRDYSMRQRFFYVAKMIGQSFLETTSPLLYLLCVDVCCISFLFLGWKGFSLNKFKMIINYQSLAFNIPCLVFSCCCCSGRALEGRRASFSQLLYFVCVPFLVFAHCYWDGQGGLFNSS